MSVAKCSRRRSAWRRARSSTPPRAARLRGARGRRGHGGLEPSDGSCRSERGGARDRQERRHAHRWIEAADHAGLPHLKLARWDVTEPGAFPFPERSYDLIVSSVMVPYLNDRQTEQLVHALAARLAPGGVLLFIEQDLLADSVNFPDFELLRRVFAKDERALKRTVALGLRPLLRNAGLELLETQSFLWTDTTYGAYLQDLLGKLAADAVKAGRISEVERHRWQATLEALRADRGAEAELAPRSPAPATYHQAWRARRSCVSGLASSHPSKSGGRRRSRPLHRSSGPDCRARRG